MEYRVSIKEISKTVVEVEAESFEAAKEKVEAEYWKNPSAYILEPEDTFFEYVKSHLQKASVSASKSTRKSTSLAETQVFYQ